jgi:nucleolar protein 9
MPQENKKRGRWADKKRKREQYEEGEISFNEHYSGAPEQANQDGHFTVQGETGDDFISFGQRPSVDDTPFYGLLDQQEQEYYANVNAKLELNDFESSEDKAMFLDAVYRESHGKELKIASSQSCSRYLERIIRFSSVEEVKGLFGKFVGHFLHLVQHRFASHCCEALFLKTAASVGRDAGPSEQADESKSFEQLFLTVVDELEPNLGYLLTERFASHVVRVLLLVFSSEPLDDSSTNSVLASRRKGKIEHYATEEEPIATRNREIPESFHDALSRMIKGSVSNLNTTYIRALATHPTGNPILQLLLRLELLHSGKSKAKDSDSILHRLLPDESLEEDTGSGKWIQGLLYDPTGSRLLETIVQHAPGKMFKKLYRNILKRRIGAMARNDIASYVAIRVLERLSKEDLEDARDQILPEMPTLVSRNRVVIIKVLVERCSIRHMDVTPVIHALRDAYGGDSGTLLLKMLKVEGQGQPAEESDTKENGPTERNPTRTADIHGSLLAQALLQSPATFDLIHQSLQLLPDDTLVRLANDPAASRVIQKALDSPASTPQSNRKLIPKFYGHMGELAVDVSGSYLADALWGATEGSHFMKERLAKELQAAESQLRESRYGRTVWKNWSMDVYQRRPMEWQALAKGLDYNPEAPPAKKTALELARERFASQKNKAYRPTTRSNTVFTNA